MNLFRSSRSRSHYPIEDDRPAKRISTPAGQRLSVILENKRSKSPASTDSTAKINVTTESTFCNDPSHQHVNPVQHSHKNEKKSGGIFAAFTGGRLSTPDNCETRGNNGSNLSVSVWSDKDDEKFGHVRHRRKKGIFGWGWKKTALIIAILLALIVGLAVGLAMGLKKNHKNPSATTAEDSHSAGGTTNNNQNSHPGSPSSNTEAPSRPAAVKPTLPPNFPVGTFSFVVFLDTTTPECTSNPDTWTCAPKTDYYSDPQKALTVFNWQVTGSSGSYKISTQGEDQIFDTTFQNEPLQLLDAGKDTERLKFQISRSKTVNMTGTLGGSKGDFECEYDATNIQGVLYTKMTRTYPDDTIAVKNTPNPEWPFAVRIEQNVAGGQGVPSCHKSSGGSVDIKGQDASTLCACLYRNWTQ